MRFFIKLRKIESISEPWNSWESKCIRLRFLKYYLLFRFWGKDVDEYFECENRFSEYLSRQISDEIDQMVVEELIGWTRNVQD